MRMSIEKVRLALAPPTTQSDDQLLTAFVEHADAEAFAALLDRHARMVLSVCRRVTRNEADAEDAFQATFLVLATRARSISPRKMLPGWLYGVAYRAAARVRTAVARRRVKEQELASVTRDVPPREKDAELLAALDAEIARLPDQLRVPLVLCELEGRTRKEAAQQLGWPEGTVASRLARARRALAQRLTRANQDGPATVLAVLSNLEAPSVPVSLLVSTREVATAAMRAALPDKLPAAAIAQEVIRSMLFAKLKLAGLALAGLVAVALVVGAVAGFRTQAAPLPAEVAQEKAVLDVLPARFPTPYTFLELPEVHKDLGLTPRQVKAVTEALKKTHAALGARIEGAGKEIVPPKAQPGDDLVGGAGILNVEKMTFELYGNGSGLAATIGKTLTSQQLLRLRQLGLQAMGSSALTNRRVVRALKLTERQEDDIEDVLAACRKAGPDFLEIPAQPGAEGPGTKARAKAHDRAMARCLALLDKRQRRLWAALTGKMLSTAVLLKAAERQKNVLEGLPEEMYGTPQPFVFVGGKKKK
jgi:RNA polymerase sigma-70 factor (ECF subfamily)